MPVLLGILIAFATGFAVVTVYYVLVAVIQITAQRYVDELPMALNAVLDFPVALPEVIFNRMVSWETRKTYFPGKEGYLRKQAIFFAINVVLYSAPAYFIFVR